MTLLDRTWRILSVLAWALSFEWIMTRTMRPNSGAVILLRAFLIALILFGGVLSVLSSVDPDRTWQFSQRELQLIFIDKLSWGGAIFGAVYAALYARFASQWNYLADLYNSIKSAEAASCQNNGALAEWKAAFIEDAQVLHLATKESFVSVIRAWGGDSAVKKAFSEHAPGGEVRLKELLDRVEPVYDRCSQKYAPKPSHAKTKEV